MENRRSQRRTTRPVCEALESRELLNASHSLKLPVRHTAAAIHHTLTRTAPAPSSFLKSLTFIQGVSTIPANGDLNPYGVAFVPSGFPSGGLLTPGDILVSNFNNSTNTQGTGTTIVNIARNGTPNGIPNATQTLFSTQGASLGLDMGLAVLKSGFVLVGNVPNNPQTTVGTSTSPNPQGSILVLDKSGTWSKPSRTRNGSTALGHDGRGRPG